MIVIYTTPSDSRAMRRNSRYDVVGWRRHARALDVATKDDAYVE